MHLIKIQLTYHFDTLVCVVIKPVQSYASMSNAGL